MLFFKTQRGGINLCMNGFRYQKFTEITSGIKWRCYENRNKSINCLVFLYTSYNQGDDDHPQFDFNKITGDHNHAPEKNKYVIEKFKSDLKEMTQSRTIPPSTSTYNQLAASMKLEMSELSQLPLFNSIRKN